MPFYIITGILLIMLITNPGEAHFKSFVRTQLGKRNFPDKDIEASLLNIKTKNYILFSQYTFRINDYGVPMEGNYIGVFRLFLSVGNFTVEESQ